jgi:ADP-heptose:LPS heptosyltransferase
MRLNTKVAIDRLWGPFSIALLMLFQRKKRLSVLPSLEKPNNFFVLKLLGMGSIVQATPLLNSLKSRYPEARLIFVTRKGNEQLTKRIACIDQTLTVDDSSIWSLSRSLLRVIKKFWERRDNCVINLEVFSNLATVIILISKARWKAGFFLNEEGLRLSAAIDFLVFFNQAAPLSETYLQIGRAIGIIPASPTLAELETTAEDGLEVDILMQSLNIDPDLKTIILVNPNSSDLLPERRWPAERFSKLVEMLIDHVPNLHVLLIGSPTERDYAEFILQLVSPEYRARVANAAGRTRLGGLIELIRRSKLLLSIDSGPMHFAFSTGTPTLAFFGPVAPWQRSCETKAQGVFLYHRVYCSPCVHNFIEAPCKGNNVCMQLISVEEAFATAIALLNARLNAPNEKVEILYVDGENPLGVIRAVSN